MKPAQKRAVVRYFRTGFRVSERRACHLVGVARSSYRYRSQAADQTALRLRLRDLAATRVPYGYRRLHVPLRREGWRVNHKRVYRLYREGGLGIRGKRRKKLASAPRSCLHRRRSRSSAGASISSPTAWSMAAASGC